MSRLSLSVVVPTKDRIDDLSLLISSIAEQITQPDELVIIDQSETSSEDQIYALLRNVRFEVKYTHDVSIGSLVEAKSVGVSTSTKDIICFLDDDLLLDKDYLAQIVQGFTENPKMVGCSGMIKNQFLVSPFIFDLVYRLFFRGILYDPRRQIFRMKSSGLVETNMICGGVSAWRRLVFCSIDFDVKNNFFFLEDVEFSTRVEKFFPRQLFINLDAKVFDTKSSVNRKTPFQINQSKVKEGVMYFKKRRETPGALMDISLALCWWFFAAVHTSFKRLTISPIRGFFSGLFSGMKTKLEE